MILLHPELLATIVFITMAGAAEIERTTHIKYCLKEIDEDYLNLDAAMMGFDPHMSNPTKRLDPGVRSKIFHPTVTLPNGKIITHGIIEQAHQDIHCDADLTVTVIKSYEEYLSKHTSFSISREDIPLNYERSKRIDCESKAQNTRFCDAEEKKLKEIFHRGGEIVQAYAECETHIVGISLFVKPLFTDAFLDGLVNLHVAAKSLQSVHSRDVFEKFVDSFGTHLMKKAYLGSRLLYERRFSTASKDAEKREERIQCVADAAYSSIDTGIGFSRTSRNCSTSFENTAFFEGHSISNSKVLVIGPQPKTISSWEHNATQSSVAVHYELENIVSIFRASWFKNIPLDDKYAAVPARFLPQHVETLDGTAIEQLFNKHIPEYYKTLGKPEINTIVECDDLPHTSFTYGGVIVTGGYDGAFDMASTESFKTSQRPDLPVATRGIALAQVKNSVIACGGQIGNTTYTITSHCYRLDLLSGDAVWAEMVSMPSGMNSATAVVVTHDVWFVQDSHAHVFHTKSNAFQTVRIQAPVTSGHCSVSNATHSYIVAAGAGRDEVWVNTASYTPLLWHKVATLPRYRRNVACLWYETNIIITGGWDGVSYSSVHILDLISNNITIAADMLQGRYSHGMILLDGRPAVIGGTFKDSTNNYPKLNTVETYNMATDEWEPHTFTLEFPRQDFGLLQIKE